MKLLADENMDRLIVERLRELGHSVLYVAEIESGISDDAVLEAADRQGAVLVTADHDFGELVYRQRRISAGVVLVRLAGLSSEAKARIVCGVIQGHEPELQGAFTVITPGAVRIRRRT